LKSKLTLKKEAADSAKSLVILLFLDMVLYAEHMNNDHCESIKFHKFYRAFGFLFQELLHI
jgi:hypothetical protein